MVSAVEAALSWRARVAMEAGPGEVVGAHTGHEAASAPADELLGSLRHHLLAGETHYPARPGMVELRRHVGVALPGVGYPERGPDGVLITVSEGESLFVTLLGLGAGKGTRFTGSAPGRHQRLFDWMGLVRAQAGAAAALHYWDAAHDAAIRAHAGGHVDQSLSCVHAIGDRLFARGGQVAPGSVPQAANHALANVIVIGTLDGLAAMRPFRLGFVAADPKTLAGITKWKQASSICSPAPSQRAALWALGVRP